MIHVKNLTKHFGRITAIDGLSFTVSRGEIVGFLGPNGAGKTTTMRILAGYLPASSGYAEIAGSDVFTDSMAVREHIGYLPENVPLYGDMRVLEYLRYRGSLKGLRGRNLQNRINTVLEQCGLLGERNAMIARLSKGYRQRVGLADALIHDPEVLILDEPTIGLDPTQIRHIRELIRGLADHYTVLLSSHILPEVEKVCGRVLIMNKGRIVASDTPDNLRGMLHGQERVTAEIHGSRRAIITALEQIDGVTDVTCEPLGEWTRVICTAGKGRDLREDIFGVVCRNAWRLRELAKERERLEDVFSAIIDGETIAPPIPSDDEEDAGDADTETPEVTSAIAAAEPKEGGES